MQNPWLNAWDEPIAGLWAPLNGLHLQDLENQGEYNLIVADIKRKLRVYNGTHIAWETTLQETPSCIHSYYPDNSGVPNLAIGSGPSVFIYRNSRPYYKFTLPIVELDAREIQIWQSFTSHGDISQGVQQLIDLRQQGNILSTRSLQLLCYTKTDDQRQYINEQASQPLQEYSTVVCLSSLQKDSDDNKAVSLLVIGTEHKELLFLDNQGNSIIFRCKLSGVPCFLDIQGQYTQEYRVIIATRDQKVLTLRNGDIVGVIELETPTCGIARVDRNLYVGQLNKKIHCFHVKGRKMYTIYTPQPITCICLMSLTRTRHFKGLLAAIEGGEVRLYKGKQLLTSFIVGDRVQSMLFGTFRKEEGSLILNTASGGLIVKILDNKAQLEIRMANTGPPAEQDIPLKIPSKSRLYVEQQEREISHARQSYISFIRDLTNLKLTVARSFLRLQQIDPGQGNRNQLKLNSFLQGIGPLFTVNLELRNHGNQSFYDVTTSIAFNPKQFRIIGQRPFFSNIVPGLDYKQSFTIESIEGAGDTIKVYLSSPLSKLPLISSTVILPNSEAD